MVSGGSLRRAREAAGMTQQEVADAIGVSLRTLGTYERTGVVPMKFHARLVEILPDAQIDLGERDVSPPPETLDPAGVEAMRGAWRRIRAKIQQLEKLGMTEDEIVGQHIELVRLMSSVNQTARVALDIGVRRDLIRSFLNSAIAILGDAGTGGLFSNDGEHDPVKEVIYRLFNTLAALDAGARPEQPTAIGDDPDMTDPPTSEQPGER